MMIATLFLWSCRDTPEYPPPAQYQPPPSRSFAPVGPFVEMGDSQAGSYLLRDISKTSENGAWRWAYRHPEMRFFVESARAVRFRMDCALPDAVFRQVGPVTLTLLVNGKPFDKVACNHGGNFHYDKPVRPDLLMADSINTVAIEPDKVWVSQADGAALSFVIARAGFVQ